MILLFITLCCRQVYIMQLLRAYVPTTLLRGILQSLRSGNFCYNKNVWEWCWRNSLPRSSYTVDTVILHSQLPHLLSFLLLSKNTFSSETRNTLSFVLSFGDWSLQKVKERGSSAGIFWRSQALKECMAHCKKQNWNCRWQNLSVDNQ